MRPPKSRSPQTAEGCWIATRHGFVGASWHLPTSARVRTTGVLIVPGIAHEERTMASGVSALAAALANDGFPALLIDLHGTSQSSGSLAAADIGDRWREDIRAAVQHLRDAGVSHVVAVGVRLGALLMADALGDDAALDMVAWAPIASGRRYARELKIVESSGIDEFDPTPGAVSIAGHEIPAPVLQHLKTLELAKSVSSHARNLLVVDAAEPLGDEWLDAHRAAGATLSRQESVEVAPWLFSGEARQATPARDIEGIVAWCASLDGVHGERSAASPWRAPSLKKEISFSVNGVAIRERLVRIEPVGLTGILTERASAPSASAVRLLMTMVGPGRMFPDFARSEASKGNTSLRFDFAGFSGSSRRPDESGGELYELSNRNDVLDAIEFLRRNGYRRAVLLGFCAGAWSMIHAGPVPGVVGLAAINVALYRQADLSARELISFHGHVVSKLLSMLRNRFGLDSYVDKVERSLDLKLDPVRRFEAYCDAGVDMLLGYGQKDLGLAFLARQLKDNLSALAARSNLRTKVYQGLGHLTEGHAAREALLTDISAFFDEIDHRAQSGGTTLPEFEARPSRAAAATLDTGRRGFANTSGGSITTMARTGDMHR